MSDETTEPNDNWDSGRAMLDILAPARVFSSAFVDKLLL